MGIKSLLSKVLGGGEKQAPAAASAEYKGYRITAHPKAQGGQFYTAGMIAKDFPEGTREQYFIRADTHSSQDTAADHAITKARQIIDEQGDGLFKDQT